jgi:hypothetical protein
VNEPQSRSAPTTRERLIGLVRQILEQHAPAADRRAAQ